MERLQVKYVKTEEELNEFLKTLHVYEKYGEKKYPVLGSIQYVGLVSCEGNNDSIKAGTNVMAAVQYFIEVE